MRKTSDVCLERFGRPEISDRRQRQNRGRVSGIDEPGAPESGMHGDDLARGSGSFDGIIGTRTFACYERWYFTAGVQYAIRSKGDFDYQFASDLTWPDYRIRAGLTWRS